MRGEITKQLRERLDGLGVKWRASQLEPDTKTLIDGADFRISINEIMLFGHVSRFDVGICSYGGVPQYRVLEMIWPLICNEVY